MKNVKKTTVVKNYRELEQLYPLKRRIRSTIRDITIFGLSGCPKMEPYKGYIRFPYYHHVFDDERNNFNRHLRYLKNYGDFITLDAAVDILGGREGIPGNYFCITFDDGFKNCATNALPILAENECPAAFFLPTDYIGYSAIEAADITHDLFPFISDIYSLSIEFLDWADVRKLVEAGMTIGSHTCSHAHLINLNAEQVRSEMVKSKEKMERKLGLDCYHFACPWGIPGKDFKVPGDQRIAKEVGYKSFLTTERGPNCKTTDPFSIRRDHILAKWGTYQLRYFFSKRS